MHSLEKLAILIVPKFLLTGYGVTVAYLLWEQAVPVQIWVPRHERCFLHDVSCSARGDGVEPRSYCDGAFGFSSY